MVQQKRPAIALAAPMEMGQLPCMNAFQESPRMISRVTRRTGRYALVGAEPAAARRVWIALHGYAQLVPRFVRHFAGIVPPDSCVVAPEGLNRFYIDLPQRDGGHLQRVGATWMTREQREDDIADTMAWLDSVYDAVMGANVTSLGVLAFSQGVATASRWITHRALQPQSFVVWAGGLAHDVSDEALAAALSRAHVSVVRGDEDALMSEAQAAEQVAQLQRLAKAATLVNFKGGHVLDRAVLAPLLDALSP